MRLASRIAQSTALAILAATIPARAVAGYTCEVLDVPGAAEIQVLQVNDANQVAAGTDLGGFVLTDEGWQQLPPPPISSGWEPDDLAATGINDFGVIAGAAAKLDRSEGFILSGGEYTFLSHPSHACVAFRALANSGVATGTFGDCQSADTMSGLVYNPGSSPDYPLGFTEIVPTLDGIPANQTIAHQMNGMGQFVGSARIPGRLPRFGFLYDPNWRSHGLSQLITLFRVDGLNTAARGINDWGHIAGFVVTPAGEIGGFLLTSLGQRAITCPQLPGWTSVVPESINNHGVVAGGITDPAGVSHGLIARPDPVDGVVDLLRATQGLAPGVSLETKLLQAQASIASGDAPAACGALGAFLNELRAQTGKKVMPDLANKLATEALAVSAQMSCGF